MKRFNLLVVICIILLVAGCNNLQTESRESFADGWIVVNDGIQIDGMIMVNDKTYYYIGYEVPQKIDRNAILGKITSVVDYFHKPTENGQANFKIKGAKYAQYEDDIVVQIHDEWILFKNEENMISGFSVGHYDFLTSELSDEEIFKVFTTIRKYIIVDEDYEYNLDSIIEISFNECGIYDSSIIDYAISNFEITVTGLKK